MWALFRDLAGILRVPDDPAGLPLYRWRLLVACIVVFEGVVLVTHIALACGFITLFGFSGFAQANDVTKVSKDLQDKLTIVQTDLKQELLAQAHRADGFELNQLETLIMSKRAQQCKLRTSFDADRKQEVASDLNAKIDRYEEVSHRPYRVPGCDEL